MARPRSSLTLLTSLDDEYAEIAAWYRNRLEATLPPPPRQWEPVRIGPSWQYRESGWVLPEWSLGWNQLAWAGKWLRNKKGAPWQYTMEQARFILWYLAVDEGGLPLFHSAVIQRIKGWGKDPVGASVSAGFLFAPLTFDHWKGGQPVGRDVENAWVQILAVSLEQTKTTMRLFPSMISPEARLRYGIQIGKENVWGLGDSRQIQAVAASPLAVEGAFPILTIRNETQNWNSSNSGHEMAGVLEGNAAKAETGSPARMLDMCNAYRPGEDSVAQRAREAYEATLGDDPANAEFGVMYDSVEAPAKAPLTAQAAPDVVSAVAGDSVWMNVDRIVKSILNPANPASESRRKWYNQITAAEDAWVSPQEIDPLRDPAKVVEPGTEVALFLDCSKSDDATGLVACRISDGHVFTVNMWQRPPGRRGADWLAPREDVDAAVEGVFARYRVAGFFGDPSHTLDDETMDRYWDPLFEKWNLKYRNRVRVWATGTKGKDGHAVMFDMTDRGNARRFAVATAFTLQEIRSGEFTWDGDARLRRHMLNARRYPVQGIVSIAKDKPDSKKKIDLAVCLIGARMVRRSVLTSGKRGGQLW